MAISDDLNDLKREVRELRRELRDLKYASPLGHSSISEGSLGVRVPEGIDVKPGGSVSVQGDSGIDVKPGGSFKSGGLKIGNTGGAGDLKVGGTEVDATGLKSGGTKINSAGDITNSGGELKFLVNVKGVASGNFDGYVRGGLGVEAPLEPGGPMVSLGPAVKEADRKGQSGYNNAIAARDEAAAADAKAQSAWNLANAKATTASVTAAHNRADAAWNYADAVDKVADSAQSQASASASKIGEIRSIYNAHIDAYHPGASKIT